MNIRAKYLKESLDHDILTTHIVRVFDAAVNGHAECKHAFKMFRDEDVRAVLDDKDYATWQKLKAERT